MDIEHYFIEKGHGEPLILLHGNGKNCDYFEGQVDEFRNFLKDFTLVDQREAGEVRLWKDYLVFAQLFGVADKVAENLQKLYPKQFDEFVQQNYRMSDYNSMRYMLSHISHSSSSMMSSAKSRQAAAEAAAARRS